MAEILFDSLVSRVHHVSFGSYLQNVLTKETPNVP